VSGVATKERPEMPKTEKVQKVKELTERFRAAQGAMFADYRGLTVKDATELRKTLNQADTTFAVTKNTLTRLAVLDAGLEEAVPMLEGPTAVAFMKGDALAGAKAILEATKRFPALVVKGAVVEGRVLGEEAARALATLEAKEVSAARMAGMLQAPVARMIYLLQAPLQRIAYALAERGRQGAAEAPEVAPEQPQPPPEETEAAPQQPEPAPQQPEAAPEGPEASTEQPEAAPEGPEASTEQPEAAPEESEA
jgi:large subunit ribosomal protein L10